MTDAVDIRCPACNRWLAKVSEYGLTVCPNCGWEIEVRSKAKRQEREHRPRTSTKG